MSDMNQMLTVILIISRLSILPVLFKSLKLLLQVVFAHLVFLVAGVAALPLDHIQQTEEHSKDDYAGQVHREAIQDIKAAVVDF